VPDIFSWQSVTQPGIRALGSAEQGSMAEKRLLIFFGLTASGKSTLAKAFAEAHTCPYYNTDRERKLLAGLDPTTRRPDGIGKGIYTPELTAKTYQAMLDKAMADLAAGNQYVLLDGSYSTARDRDEVVACAHEQAVLPVFLFCYCSEEADGRWEIYQYQLQHFDIPEYIPGAIIEKIDTDMEPASLLAVLESRLINVRMP